MSSRRVQVWFQNSQSTSVVEPKLTRLTERQGQKREQAKVEAILPGGRSHSGSDSSSNESILTRTPSPRSLALHSALSPSYTFSGTPSSSSYMPDPYLATTSARKYSSFRDPTPPTPLSPATPLFGANPYTSDYFQSSRPTMHTPRSRRNSFASLPPPYSFRASVPSLTTSSLALHRLSPARYGHPPLPSAFSHPPALGRPSIFRQFRV